jgi:hypothetical protein
MRAVPPHYPLALTRRPHESTAYHQDQDQLANARVAEADAPSHHCNRSKLRELLAIQQGGGGGVREPGFSKLCVYRWGLSLPRVMASPPV